MPIEFKQGFNPKEYSKKALERTAKALERGLLEARGQIVRRTQSGKDYEGNPFIDYSDAYAKRKAKSGRNTRPDLTYTGKMLASIQVSVDKKVSSILGKIFFASANEGAKAKYNSERRKFFELSREQLKTITRKISEAFNGR